MISIQYNRIHVVKGIKLLCEILAVYAQSPISDVFKGYREATPDCNGLIVTNF